MKKGLFLVLSATLVSLSAQADVSSYTCGRGNDYEQIVITKTNAGNDGEKVTVTANGREIENVKEIKEVNSEYQNAKDLLVVLNSLDKNNQYETFRILICEKN